MENKAPSVVINIDSLCIKTLMVLRYLYTYAIGHIYKYIHSYA